MDPMFNFTKAYCELLRDLGQNRKLMGKFNISIIDST